MKKSLGITAVLLLLAGGALAYRATLAPPEPSDCPGKIVCPLTGDLICKDQCPLIDPNRPDCPGKIVCPLTGDLICKDQCPLGGCSSAPPDACCGSDPQQESRAACCSTREAGPAPDAE